MSIDFLKKVVSDLNGAKDSAAINDAANKAANYVDSLDSSIKEQAKAEGLNIFTSGETFKNYVIKDSGVDASIFSQSLDQLENLNLSKKNVSKMAGTGKQENAIYDVLNTLYSNDVFKELIDANGDGKISNKEAQQFLQDVSEFDEDGKNLSFDDFEGLIDSIDVDDSNGLSSLGDMFQNAYKNLTDKFTQAIDNMKNQGPIQMPSGGGVSYNPYVSGASNGSSGVSSNGSTGAGAASGEGNETKSLEDKKADLENKIQEYSDEISKVKDESEESVKTAVEERDNAKKEMEKQIEQDDKINKETKEKYTEVTGKIQDKKTEISNCEADLTQKNSDLKQGEDSLSTLKNSLDSLKTPEGADENVKAKIEERKSQLTKQIDEQTKKNEEIKKEVEKLEQKKKDFEKELKELETQQQELKKEIEETASEETKQAIKTYEEKEKAVEETKTNKLTELEGKLETARNDLKKVEQDINEKANKSAQNTFDASFEDMLNHVFKSEGGFSNHPNDHGGATNFGITESTYRNYKGDPNANVKNITKEEAAQIYYKNYYQASGAEKYAKSGNNAYAFAVFDAAVNHGVGAAKKMNAQANGDVDKFMQIRKQKYISIVANNSSQKCFAKGWQNRWNSVYSFIDPSHKYENYIGA